MPLLRMAVDDLRGETGEYAALRLNALGVLAVCHDTLGNYDEAEAVGRRIVAESERVLGKLEPNTIIRLGNLALVLRRQGKFAEAANMFRDAVARVDKSLPPEHPDRAEYRNKLGNALQKQGRFAEADRAFNAAENLTLKYAGTESAAAAADAYYRGSYYRDLGDYRRAIDSFDKAIALSEQLQGKGSYLATISRIQLAGTLLDQGRVSDAATAISVATPALSTVAADHQAIAGIVQARIASARGDFAGASRIFARILASQEATLGQDHWMLAPLLVDMSAHHRKADDTAQAVAVAKRAVSIAERNLPEGNWMTGLALAQYALALERAGRADAAANMARRARVILAKTFGAQDPRIAELAPLLRPAV